MLNIDQALAAIETHVPSGRIETVPLGESLGRVLAESVTSSIDSPPFDKALMDGFAVRAADVADGQATLRLIDEVTAGQVASKPIASGEAIQIMTGAPIPEGADAVVRIEDTRIQTGPDNSQTVVIDTRPATVGQDLVRQGTSMRQGDTVLPVGRRLRPQELGLLAELGHPNVAVRQAITVGVLATGDELVTVDQVPGPGQIRNSNEAMLAAQVRACGAVARELGIARDTPEDLAEKIGEGLRCDVLLLSGGVSAGRLDLVPGQLAAAGVSEIFHRVRIKPGKPVWFGATEGCLVFGLPGNPVSSMVCFELFVRTALRKISGILPAQPTPFAARLSTDFEFRGDRPTYFPSQCGSDGEGPHVTPISWHGSSDLRSTTDANAMIFFPAGDRSYKTGEWVDVFGWTGGS
ncbi:MAG: molybdopterin molybdotransferase MoeA [Planctomycetaceae bacterium]|jgi:molybdopterin molybdotransferase|nr:molybdopterin molybdotransferase MoeA [Planctomycetaceae bacterium]